MSMREIQKKTQAPAKAFEEALAEVLVAGGLQLLEAYKQSQAAVEKPDGN